MIRSKKFFAVGSIVSMAIMFVTLMLGFVEDGYYYSYYYSYSYSFAERAGAFYWPMFALATSYIAFGIVAVALYNKRIKAINIINLILTSVVYMFGMAVAFVAIDCGNVLFSIFMLAGAVSIAFPFHLVVDIFALIAQRYKIVQTQPTYTYQEPAYAAPAAPAASFANNDAIETLKQLKELYEAGVLTEEEYKAKRQQYVSKI